MSNDYRQETEISSSALMSKESMKLRKDCQEETFNVLSCIRIESFAEHGLAVERPRTLFSLWERENMLISL